MRCIRPLRFLRALLFQAFLQSIAKNTEVIFERRLTDPPADDELALMIVVHHTTAVKGNRWELSLPKSFLKDGAFHFQQINTVSIVRLIRRLGNLTDQEMEQVQLILRHRLGF